MLDYKTIIRLKKMGLNNLAKANGAKCKWDSVGRVLSRCEMVWGSLDGVLVDKIFLTRENCVNYGSKTTPSRSNENAFMEK